ncbi:hypothetical protein GCM10020331_000060 [Ectobacillus funiculus]
MALQTLTEDEWVKIAQESEEIGYCLTGPAGVWKPERKAIQEDAISEGLIRLETGIFIIKAIRTDDEPSPCRYYIH